MSHDITCPRAVRRAALSVRWASVLLVLLLAGCSNATPLHPTADRFGADYQALSVAERGKLPSDGRLSTDALFFKAMAKACRAQSKARTGDQAALFSALTQYYEQGATVLGDVVTATEQLEAVGGLDLQVLVSSSEQSELTAYLTQLQALQEAYQSLVDTEMQADRVFEASITKTVSAAAVDHCVAVFHAETTSPQRANLRAVDEVMFQGMREAVELLIDEWGSWHLNQTSDAISFSNAAAEQTWDRIMKKLQAAQTQADAPFEN